MDCFIQPEVVSRRLNVSNRISVSVNEIRHRLIEANIVILEKLEPQNPEDNTEERDEAEEEDHEGRQRNDAVGNELNLLPEALKYPEIKQYLYKRLA